MKVLKNLRPFHSRLISTIIPIIISIMCASAIIFYYNSNLVKEQAIIGIQKDTVKYISNELNKVFIVPHRNNELNQSIIDGLYSITKKSELLQNLFSRQLEIFPETNLIAIGLEDGEYIEAQRLADNTIRVGARGESTGGDLLFWNIKEDGSFSLSDEKVTGYDPRVRPWYRTSIVTNEPAWSPVYFYSSNRQAAISANRLLSGVDGEINGVLSTSITLDNISMFLRDIENLRNGFVFLTEPDGQLIASSNGIPLLNEQNSRFNIADLENPGLAKGTKQLLSDVFEKKDNSKEPVSIKVKFSKRTYRGICTEYSGPYNLELLVFLFLPETAFYPDMNHSLIAGFLLVFFALTLTTFAIYKLSAHISRPVFELNTLVSSIADNPALSSTAVIPNSVLTRRDEIGLFARTFRKMIMKLQKTFLALEEEQKKYKQLIEDTGSVVLKMSESGKVLFCNDYGLKLFGYNRVDISGIDAGLLLGDDFANSFISEVFDSKPGTNLTYEGAIKRPSGEEVWITWSVQFVEDLSDAGKREILCTGQDISKRHEMEEKLFKSLEEKNVLLNEIHHRVKNNLQIIISMLNLQHRKNDGPEIVGTIQSIKRRIMSMSLVHELLYRSDSLSKISLAKYLGVLTDALRSTFGIGGQNIKVTLDADPLYTSIETCLTIGLIINELLSNAYKHAFPDGRDGTIAIAAQKHKDGTLHVSVEDNGTGFDPEHVEAEPEKQGIGTLLISALSTQLEADVKIERNNGTKTTIIIPDGLF